MPKYHIGTQMVEIRDIKQMECPASKLSRFREVENLASEVRSSYYMKSASGCQAYGPDPCQWPAWWYDAVMMDFRERSEIESILMETTG